jgi:hypothetical protein
MDIVFARGGTPVTDAVASPRACIVYDKDARKELVEGEWRGPELPYVVPPELRLPMEQLSGAPSSFGGCTEDVCRRIEQMVINGSSVLAAKSVIGIIPPRWKEWKAHAKAGKYPFTTFFERMKLATAYVEATCTTTIHRAAVHPDPKVAVPAAKLKLEHIAPERYAPRSTKRVEMHASVSVDVRHLQAIATMQPAQLIGMLRQVPAVGMREWTESAVPEVVEAGSEDED